MEYIFGYPVISEEIQTTTNTHRHVITYIQTYLKRENKNEITLVSNCWTFHFNFVGW